MSTVKIMPGMTFGKLTVLSKADKQKKYRTHYICKCECGNNTISERTNLLDGKATSCGCSRIESLTTHRFSHHRLYSIWKSMMARCYNKKHVNYKHYGDRGITVCDEWHDVKNFIDDMYPTFKEKLSIERIDNSKNYCKENCRWATMQEQSRNTRSNNIVMFNGEMITIKDLSIKVGIKYVTLHARIMRSKMTIEEAVELKDKRIR